MCLLAQKLRTPLATATKKYKDEEKILTVRKKKQLSFMEVNVFRKGINIKYTNLTLFKNTSN